MPKRRRKSEEILLQPNFRRRMNVTLKSQEIIDDVLTWVPESVVQEVYEYLLIEVNDSNGNPSSYPPGGVSLALGVGLFLIYIHVGGSFRQYEKNYGISDSSMNRLINSLKNIIGYKF